MKVRIAPYILSADLGHLADEIIMFEEGGADVIHLDVMDGRFVPNITFGEKVIAAARKATSLPLDVHMMVQKPEKYFERFAGAGAAGMTTSKVSTPSTLSSIPAGRIKVAEAIGAPSELKSKTK